MSRFIDPQEIEDIVIGAAVLERVEEEIHLLENSWFFKPSKDMAK
jgi:hypothetical protein